MSMFGKEGDYIDYTLLRKRGLLKAGSGRNMGNDSIIDMTAFANSSNSAPSETSSSPSFDALSSSSSPFDMLNSLASASSGSVSSSSSSSVSDNTELSALKIKIEDIEYKLERLLERLAIVDSKLQENGR